MTGAPDIDEGQRRLLARLLELADDQAPPKDRRDPEFAELAAALEATQATGFLEPPHRASHDLRAVAAAAALPAFGPYRAVELIGVGGTGAVYRAERADGAEPRIVAVKALPADPAGAINKQRLQCEADALRRLDHPGIAKLFDIGVTQRGRPYLVMEYVEGATLREHAARAHMPLRARLELFCRICNAVQHAHERLIVHRDLKPANIIITPAGAPVLLDFGLSRLVEPGAQTLATRTIYRAMTPAYASPEQLRGESAATPSDVYSLGVILYELVTDRLPHEPQETIAGTLDVITGSAPVPPSALRNEPNPDLDAVALRALRADIGGRYGSVVELADDVRRLMEGRPVRARRATRRYLLSRWARRHALTLSIGSALAAALLVSTAVSIGLATSLSAERAEAIAARATSERISGSLARIIELADALGATGEDLTVGGLLDAAAARVDADAAGDPAAEAAVRMTIGRGYAGLGRLADAAAQFEAALAARRRFFPEGDPQIAAAMHELGRALSLLGETDRAEPLLAGALKIRREAPESPALIAQTVAAMASAAARRGDAQTAVDRYSAAIEMQRAANARADLVASLTQRARLLAEQEDHELARRDLLEALDANRAVAGEPSAAVAASLAELAQLSLDSGERSQAVHWAREALEMTRAVHGDRHPTTTWQMLVLARTVESVEPQRAEALAAEAVELASDALGERHYITAYCRLEYGRLLTASYRFQEAEQQLLAGRAACAALFGPDAPNTEGADRLLAALYQAWGR